MGPLRVVWVSFECQNEYRVSLVNSLAFSFISVVKLLKAFHLVRLLAITSSS